MAFKRFVTLTVASGFGIGYLPVMPGTAGSLAAAVLYFVLPLGGPVWILIITTAFVIGIWAGNFVEREYGKDPPLVVIDEFVGQWLTFSFLPMDPLTLTGGFLLFRIFDISKPFPANRAQRLKGGLGIMLDDVIAAVYAQAFLRLILLIIS